MVIEIPTTAPALRPAVADCGCVSHPGSIRKNAVITYMWHLHLQMMPQDRRHPKNHLLYCTLHELVHKINSNIVDHRSAFTPLSPDMYSTYRSSKLLRHAMQYQKKHLVLISHGHDEFILASTLGVAVVSSPYTDHIHHTYM